MKQKRWNQANQTMRKETRFASICFVLFLLLRQIMDSLGADATVLHGFVGVLAGLSIVNFMIGLLPDPRYQKFKKIKSTIFLRTR